MAKKYFFRTDAGSTVIPIVETETFTQDMDVGYSIGYCVVEFLDSDGETVVTPSAGTVTFTASPIGEQWHGPSSGDTTIDATLVDGDYTIPKFNGPVIKGRMVLAGITGASFVRAYHWRDE